MNASSQPSPRRAPSGVARTLPAQPTRLIGREEEIALLRARLWRADTRLLVLTGIGGVGKTRLALAVAAELAGLFDDGARFVDLAAVRDPGRFFATIAASLGIRETEAQSLEERLFAELRERDCLLVLDNLEQIEGVAEPLGTLLAACPALVVLATSRTPLPTNDGWHYTVEPLAVPATAEQGDPARLEQNPAVALFLDRARAVRFDFTLSTRNAAAVGAICAQLDGVPLAIEMVASRISLFPPAVLLGRLTDRLDLLRDLAVDRPDRHRTMRAALAWSYDLLDDATRGVFRALAVFVAGADRAAFEAVCQPLIAGDDDPAAAGAALDRALATLVESSLLRRESDSFGEVRFRPLETVRQYALERLHEAGEYADSARRHALHFRAVAEQAPTLFLHGDQARLLVRLERDLPNIRAAITWCVAQGHTESILRLITSLRTFWVQGHQLREVYAWLTDAFSDDNAALDPPLRAATALTLGNVAWTLGDYATARRVVPESLALYRELGDLRGEFNAWTVLGNAALQLGERAAADEAYEQALAVSRAFGHPFNVAVALNNVARGALDAGDSARALALYTESLDLSRTTGNIYVLPLTLTNLAFARIVRREWAPARPLLAEALTSGYETGNWRVLALTILAAALLASGERHDRRALRLLGGLEGLRASLGLAHYPSERPYEEQILHAATLDATQVEAALAEGRALAREDLLAQAQQLVSSRDEPVPAQAVDTALPNLTRRERQLLPYVAQGFTNRRIADELHIGPRTVEMHVTNILSKLELQNRAQLASWTVEHGLQQSGD